MNIYLIILIVSVMIASFAQVLLKKVRRRPMLLRSVNI